MPISWKSTPKRFGNISIEKLTSHRQGLELGLYLVLQGVEVGVSNVEALCILPHLDGFAYINIDEFYTGCLQLKGEAEEYRPENCLPLEVRPAARVPTLAWPGGCALAVVSDKRYNRLPRDPPQIAGNSEDIQDFEYYSFDNNVIINANGYKTT